MPTPAPMTPQTLAQIRSMALTQEAPVIANALNWELPRLSRVAKEHSIELLNGSPFASRVMDAPTRCAPVHVPSPPAAPIAPATLDEIIAQLATRQRQLCDILKRDIGGRLISGSEIAERMGVSKDNVWHYIEAANSNLRRSRCGFVIDGRSARGGGYRLVAEGSRS